MKTIIITILLSAALGYGQTISDSTQSNKKIQEQEQILKENQEKDKTQNQIGPKEKPQSDVKENRKKKDVFIDKDGDGICDSRQSGMSFNKMRKRAGSGQKGPNGSGGSGGNGNSGGSGNGQGGNK